MPTGLSLKGCLTGLLMVLLPVLTGCETLSYYTQAGTGQIKLLTSREAVKDLIQRPSLDPVTRQKLLLTQQLLEYAREELALPVGDAYRDYVDLKRPYPVWAVIAAPPLSLTPLNWCYPIIGCASYRGYFKREAAEDYADKLQTKGFDTYVRGVPAYSTLGFFDDPLLSSFIHWGEADLAGLLFHELSHRKLYIANDTEFNESFASAVERLSVKAWLTRHKKQHLLDRFQAHKKEREAFISFLTTYRQRLKALYNSDKNAKEKYKEKRELLAEMINQYDKQFPTGRYGFWLKGTGSDPKTSSIEHNQLNNAKLASFTAYNRWVDGFTAIRHCSKNWQEFYRQVEKISKHEKQQRDAILKQYSQLPSLLGCSALLENSESH